MLFRSLYSFRSVLDLPAYNVELSFRPHWQNYVVNTWSSTFAILRSMYLPASATLIGRLMHYQTLQSSHMDCSSLNEPVVASEPNLDVAVDSQEPIVSLETQSISPSATVNNDVQKDPKNHAKSQLQRLLESPLLRDPVRRPRHPIVLCHGLYGFDVWGPKALPRIHYWSNVMKVLRGQIGAEVIVTSVPSVGSVEQRAGKLHEFLCKNAPKKELNLLGHSMGGLDTRYLVSHLNKPNVYRPLSLTTICTPHRGSPFMDWCTANIGIGALREALNKKIRLPYSLSAPLLNPASDTAQEQAATLAARLAALPASITTLLLGMVDSPAYSNLTTAYCTEIFNPKTPDEPGIKYYSVAARRGRMSIFHPLWLPQLILNETEASNREKLVAEAEAASTPLPDFGNDGLVTIESAKWGEFLGILENADHWQVRGSQGFGGQWDTEGKGGKPWNPLAASDKVANGAEADATTSNVSGGDRARLTETFQWISGKIPVLTSGVAPVSSSLEAKIKKGTTLAAPAKFDLETFYIALCKHLYDEGF